MVQLYVGTTLSQMLHFLTHFHYGGTRGVIRTDYGFRRFRTPYGVHADCNSVRMQRLEKLLLLASVECRS